MPPDIHFHGSTYLRPLAIANISEVCEFNEYSCFSLFLKGLYREGKMTLFSLFLKGLYREGKMRLLVVEFCEGQYYKDSCFIRSLGLLVLIICLLHQNILLVVEFR